MSFLPSNHFQPEGLSPQIKKVIAANSGKWLIGFALATIICQLLLLFEQIAPFRFIVRMASFGLSLLFLLFFVLQSSRTKPHPAQKISLIVFAILVLSFLHPETGSLPAGIVHFLLYVAILAPLFWVPKLGINMRVFRKLVFVLWGFHTLSSVFGILQIYFPERFESQLSLAIESRGEDYVQSLRYELASGKEIFRPMGLTDVPGGAATAGFYAVIFSFGFLLTSKRRYFKYLCITSMILGMTCVAFSQVRLIFVMTILFLLAYSLIFVGGGKLKKFFKVFLGSSIVMAIAITWAVVVGGENVKNRLLTLIEEKPTTVYYQERGFFLEDTIKTFMPRYPFGAGLARWGMIGYYFNVENDLYAEIQITGWLFDGGIPLIVVYSWMLVVTLGSALKIIRKQFGPNRRELNVWASLVVAYNLGVIVAVFNSNPFIGQTGLEFWFFNAALYAVSRPRYISFASPPRVQA